jgi:hypothetical protein
MKIRNLSVLAYTQGFTLWHYHDREAPLGALLAPGYFDDARDMLAPYDVLHVTTTDASATLVVSRIARDTVTILTQSWVSIPKILDEPQKSLDHTP